MVAELDDEEPKAKGELIPTDGNQNQPGGRTGTKSRIQFGYDAYCMRKSGGVTLLGVVRVDNG
jgi:hypothetical protein